MRKCFLSQKKKSKRKNIAKDFKAYFKTLDEYADFLKELIKKYDIKPTGNLQRLTFEIDSNYNYNNTNSKQQDFDFKFIMVVVDLTYFPSQ